MEAPPRTAGKCKSEGETEADASGTVAAEIGDEGRRSRTRLRERWNAAEKDGEWISEGYLPVEP